MICFRRRLLFTVQMLACIWLACVALDAAMATSTRAQAAGAATVYPSLFQTDSLRGEVLTGIRLTVNDQFAPAESLFKHLADVYPASPIGPLFIAAAIHAQMLDQESPARHAAFENWLYETKRRAEKWRAAEPESGELEFMLGAAEGYDAVFESRWGGWFAALQKGLRAKNHFARALERDSTLVDAYLGIGNYNYWKSVKTDFINWLPIFPDDREKGLRQLRQVTSDGVLSCAAARASLCWALINEGDYAEALAQADTLAAEYPDAKGPLWIKSYACAALYRWDDALNLCDELERRILTAGPGNYYNLIDCAFYEAQCHYSLGQWTHALAACHKALAYPAPPDTQERQKGKLKKLRELQRKLKEMVAGSASSD